MISKLIVGAGCFWGVEVLFEEMPGVKKVISGYAGGHTKNPTYEEVCTGKSGHIEVIEIEYENNEVKYEELLDKFFFIHDPTQMNRQGPDIGEQYKSVIFYNSDEEKKISESKIEEINKILITASGGPFLNYKVSQLKKIKPIKALKHPKWKMGKKITIDSATLMNKFLELIEAQRLFNLPPEKLDVIKFGD